MSSLLDLVERSTARKGWIIGLAMVLAVAAIPLVGGQYLLTVLVLAGIYSIASVGVNLFMGYTGQVSFGHNAFAAIGGYTSAILTTSLYWPPLLSAVIGVALSFIAAWVVGYPTLRLRGHYLAIATFALGQITYVLSVQLETLTNGFVGISGIPPLGVGSWMLVTVSDYFYAVWVLAGLSVWTSHRIVNSRLGRALVAIQGNEAAARSLGIDATYYKVLALGISACYVSVSGSLLAHFVSFISPEIFGMSMLLILFTALFVGGLGTVYGPVLGAVIVVGLPEVLRGFKEYSELIYAVALIAILILAPRGVYSLLDIIRPLYKARTSS